MSTRRGARGASASPLHVGVDGFAGGGEDVGYMQGRLDHLQLHVPHTVTPSGSESGRPKADVFVSRSIKAASKNLQKAFLGEYEFEW